MVRRVQSRRRIQAQTTGANAVRALQNKAMRGLPAAHDGRQEGRKSVAPAWANLDQSTPPCSCPWTARERFDRA